MRQPLSGRDSDLSGSELADLIKKYAIDQVVFAYSDTSHQYVMSRASRCWLLAPTSG